jgi:hypothetical protein
MCDGDPGNNYTSVRRKKNEPYTLHPTSLRSKKKGEKKEWAVHATSNFTEIEKEGKKKKKDEEQRLERDHQFLQRLGDCS